MRTYKDLTFFEKIQYFIKFNFIKSLQYIPSIYRYNTQTYIKCRIIQL